MSPKLYSKRFSCYSILLSCITPNYTSQRILSHSIIIRYWNCQITVDFCQTSLHYITEFIAFHCRLCRTPLFFILSTLLTVNSATIIPSIFSNFTTHELSHFPKFVTLHYWLFHISIFSHFSAVFCHVPLLSWHIQLVFFTFYYCHVPLLALWRSITGFITPITGSVTVNYWLCYVPLKLALWCSNTGFVMFHLWL